MLDIELPDGKILDVDIGDMTADDPAVKALLQKVQSQHAPTPPQQAYQSLASGAGAVRDTMKGAAQTVAGALQEPATKARDIATEAVARTVSSFTSGMPGDVGMAMEPSTPAGQMVAQAMVPQTPDQLMSTLTLGITGAVGPSVGIMGVLARSLVPAIVGSGTNYALDKEQDPTQLVSQLVGSMVGEGIGPTMKLINSQLIRKGTQNAAGDKIAEQLAGILNQKTSVKIPPTPRGFEEMMIEDRNGLTAWHGLIGKTMETSEDSLGRDLMASLTQLPPQQRQAVMFMMEDAAGMTPKLTYSPGAPLHSAPTNRVVQTTPDVALNTMIHRARKARMEMSMAKSEDKYQAGVAYGQVKDDIRTALAGANPALAQKYDAMNKQYAVDLDAEFGLKQLEKAGAWFGDNSGTHFDPTEAGNAILKVDMKDVQQNEKILKLFAGESEIPGARPATREGVMRMFMQLVTQAPSLSLGTRNKVITVPTAPVAASHVRALQDYLAGSMLHGMGEAVFPQKAGE